MNIFIAGISYNLSNADLGELFEEFGEVISAKIVMDRETGRSKGFGFVEMPNDEEGNAAIAALNEKEIDGKTLAVSVARPREEGPRRNSNYGGGNRGGGLWRRHGLHGGDLRRARGRGHGGRHADGRAGDGPLCAGDPSGLPREMRRNDLQGLEGS